MQLMDIVLELDAPVFDPGSESAQFQALKPCTREELIDHMEAQPKVLQFTRLYGWNGPGTYHEVFKGGCFIIGAIRRSEHGLDVSFLKGKFAPCPRRKRKKKKPRSYPWTARWSIGDQRYSEHGLQSRAKAVKFLTQRMELGAPMERCSVLRGDRPGVWQVTRSGILKIYPL